MKNINYSVKDFALAFIISIIIISPLVYAILDDTRINREVINCINQTYTGKNYKLRRLSFHKETRTKFKSSYFLIFGSQELSSDPLKTITFSWENNDGDYILSEVDLKNVRIRFTDIESPHVRFYPKKSSSQCGYTSIISQCDHTSFMKEGIDYILILCKEEDYKMSVNLESLP